MPRSTILRSGPSAIAIWVCATFLSACSLDDMATLPTGEQRTHARFTTAPYNEAPHVAAISIPIGPSEYPKTGGIEDEPVHVRPHTWYRVTTTGTVTLAPNPTWESVCASISQDCSFPYAGTYDAASGLETARAVTILSVPQPISFVHPSGVDPLVLSPASGEFKMTRSLAQAWHVCTMPICKGVGDYTWNGTYTHYLQTSTQKLIFTAVPIPLSVIPDTTEVPEGTFLSFQTRTPETRTNPTRHRWFFAAGDTAAAPAWPDTSTMRPVCGYFSGGFGGTHCDARITASGRMYVAADVGDNGARVLNASPVIRAEGQSRVSLTCDGDLGRNRVTRGKLVRCTATRAAGTGSVPLAITGWSFQGRPRADGAPTATGWAGEMVKSGTVVVYWKRQGSTTLDSTAAAVEVVPRSWSEPTLPAAEERFEACTPPLTRECPVQYPPVYQRDMGRTVPFYDRTYTWLHIQGGPNQGYNYVGGDEFFLHYRRVLIVVNELLRNPRDPYFRDPQFKERRRCDVATFAEEVRQHEFTHYHLLKEGLAKSGIGARWEADVYEGSPQAAREHFATHWAETETELLDLGDHRHLMYPERFPSQDPNCYVGLLPNPTRNTF